MRRALDFLDHRFHCFVRLNSQFYRRFRISGSKPPATSVCTRTCIWYCTWKSETSSRLITSHTCHTILWHQADLSFVFFDVHVSRLLMCLVHEKATLHKHVTTWNLYPQILHKHVTKTNFQYKYHIACTPSGKFYPVVVAVVGVVVVAVVVVIMLWSSSSSSTSSSSSSSSSCAYFDTE